MMEKMDMLAYLVENGYDLPLTMDEMAFVYTVEELWAMVQKMLGDE